MKIRRAKLIDYLSVEKSDINDSSYKNLGYPIGCSKSELNAALEAGDLALISDDGTVAGFARVKSIAAYNCYFDFYVINEAPIPQLLQLLQKHISNKYEADRFYVQLLPFETREISCLEQAGYYVEASMDRQIFIKGRHHDLLILRSAE